jgi:signal transduction histidine kinase
VSEIRQAGRTASLRRPLPVDLVEGRLPWLEEPELERIRQHSDALTAEVGRDAAALLCAAMAAAAAAARLALEGRLTPNRADALVVWTADEAAAPASDARLQVYLRTLVEVVAQAPTPGRALDGLLGALAGLGPAAAVRLEAEGELLRAAIGDDVGEGAIEAAVPGTCAVLLVRPAPGGSDCCRAFAEEAAHLVRVLLPSREQRGPAAVAKLEGAERRLRRLALDLHDGPAQDVAALAADAAVLRAELIDERTPARAEGVLALATEICDRLATLGRDMRDLAEVLEPRSILREPLGDILAREAAAFARRTGIVPVLEVDDDFGVMTASQQIALVRVAQEALTNVREHARATAVHVAAGVTARGVSLAVVDDGRGFDVARARRASARGRLGLSGMDARVRLLGGRLRIESRRGGPTRVEATIPRWRPSP